MTRVELGQFIKKRRKALRLSQQTVADKAAICSYQHYAKMENGELNFGIDYLLSLLDMLDIEMSLSIKEPVKSDVKPSAADALYDFRNVTVE